MKVWCSHPETVSDGGEVVCTRCGVVAGREWAGMETGSSESRANLYEVVEVGSRDATPAMSFAAERGSGDIRRYFRGRIIPDRELSRLSNMCEKLALPMPVQEHAWTLFRRAAREGSVGGAAEHACWAVHSSCRVHGVPRSEAEITGAAVAAYGRRRLPAMFTILYRHMEVPGGGGPGSDLYHFNLALRGIIAGMEAADAEFGARKAEAWRMYRGTFTEGSAAHRARRAVSAAFGVR